MAFPPIRLLLGLRSEEETPSRSPWWLTLLRILIAALIITALAGPVFNPEKETLAAGRNLLMVIDNGWAAASRWPQRQEMLTTLLQRAERNGQTVSIVGTATPAAALAAEPLSPGQGAGEGGQSRTHASCVQPRGRRGGARQGVRGRARLQRRLAQRRHR